MSEFKGTKGKWEINDSTKIVIGKQPICDVWHFGLINIDEAKCNAKLIACAPEMLEVLNKINIFIIENKDKNYMIKLLEGEVPEIEQLIKKATEL